MSLQLPVDVLRRASDAISAKIGLNFPEERWDDLTRGLTGAARDLGVKDAEELARSLGEGEISRERADILSAHLTIGETHFFRDRKSFDLLETNIIPDLIHSRAAEKRLRMWCAGCSTGEEAYSLGILLTDLLPEWRGWNIDILATDINSRALERAAEGVYGEWSFRDTPRNLRERYFTRAGTQKWKINPGIQSMVSFAFLNLVEDTYPAFENRTNAIDLLLCRNVLMYFNSSNRTRVMERLYRSIRNGGWLLVGASENSTPSSAGFAQVFASDSIGHRKGDVSQAERPVLWRGSTTSEAPLHDGRPVTEPVALRTVDDLNLQTATLVPFQKPFETPTTETEPEISATSAPDLASAFDRYRAGDFDVAEAMSLRLAEDPVTRSRAFGLLTRVYASMGRLADALSCADVAVESDRLDAGHRFVRGVVLEESGDAAGAVASFEQAIYLEGEFVLAYYALANLERRLSRRQRSLLHYRAALSLLDRSGAQDQVPESEGLTAGRLSEIIRGVLRQAEGHNERK